MQTNVKYLSNDFAFEEIIPTMLNEDTFSNMNDEETNADDFDTGFVCVHLVECSKARMKNGYLIL